MTISEAICTQHTQQNSQQFLEFTRLQQISDHILNLN